MNDTPTVSELFEALGYGKPGTDIDTATRWALVELHLRRQSEVPLAVGDSVRLVAFSDAESQNVHGFLLGRIGTIAEIRSEGVGVGESPEDPVYAVDFPGLDDALLFREEIERA